MLLQRLGYDAAAGRSRMPSELSGGMSRAAVLAAQQEWMPRLLTEVPDYRKGVKPPPPIPPAPAPEPPPSATPAQKGSPRAPAPADDDILDASPPPAAPAGKKPASDDDLILDSGDLLAVPKTPGPPAKAPTPAGDDLSLLGGTDDLAKPAGKADGDLLSIDVGTSSPKAAGGEASPAAELMPAEDWVATGGWYRPKGSFTFFYRPVGHADSFLTAWLTTLGGMSGGPAPELARTVFRKLADPEAPGACMKCHTVDATEGALRVNWQPARPAPHARPFTVFNHAAHFSRLTDLGCQTCHQRDLDSEYAKFFAASDGVLPADPHRFESNFAPLSKALCAECHKPQIAGENCLLCHR